MPHYPIFDVGIEIEFFLSRKSSTNVILNASHEMKERLGFSINQNDGETTKEAGSIKVDSRLELRTDNTVMEAQFFIKAHEWATRLDNSHNNSFNLRQSLLSLRNFALIKDFSTWWLPYIAKGEELGMKDGGGFLAQKVVFDNPGNAYSSGKMMRNAYSAITSYPTKEDEKEISFRTAGCHFHFSLGTKSLAEKLNPAFYTSNGYVHTDELIKRFDKVYETLFHDKKSQRRTDLRHSEYQTLGDYRMKFDTKTGNPTLEYRQMDAWQAAQYPDRATLFVDLCQIEGERYFSEHFKI